MLQNTFRSCLLITLIKAHKLVNSNRLWRYINPISLIWSGLKILYLLLDIRHTGIKGKSINRSCLIAGLYKVLNLEKYQRKNTRWNITIQIYLNLIRRKWLRILRIRQYYAGAKLAIFVIETLRRIGSKKKQVLSLKSINFHTVGLCRTNRKQYFKCGFSVKVCTPLFHRGGGGSNPSFRSNFAV